MALMTDRAICVRQFDYSETSQILWLFTQDHGLMRVLAKGARRTTKAGASSFDGGVDLLDEGSSVFSDRIEKDLNTLTAWKLLEGHRELRRSQRPLYLALYMGEIISFVFETRDPHPNVFTRFAATLGLLKTASLEEAAMALLLDLLEESGYMPSLDQCVNCGKPMAGERMAYFSPSRGGAVCRDCEMSIPDRMVIEPRLLGIALMLMKLPRVDGVPQRLPRLTRAQTDPLHTLLGKHMEHQTARGYRLLRHIIRKPRVFRPPPQQAKPAQVESVPTLEAAPQSVLESK
jgi:DNA repair protein RecO (recombination protein O)